MHVTCRLAQTPLDRLGRHDNCRVVSCRVELISQHAHRQFFFSFSSMKFWFQLEYLAYYEVEPRR